MNLERGDGLHLHPRLLTQANRGELKLVAVAVDFPWTGSWHDTSSLSDESVHETGARAQTAAVPRWAVGRDLDSSAEAERDDGPSGARAGTGEHAKSNVAILCQLRPRRATTE
jgi:hypothetical protein